MKSKLIACGSMTSLSNSMENINHTQTHVVLTSTRNFYLFFCCGPGHGGCCDSALIGFFYFFVDIVTTSSLFMDASGNIFFLALSLSRNCFFSFIQSFVRSSAGINRTIRTGIEHKTDQIIH